MTFRSFLASLLPFLSPVSGWECIPDIDFTSNQAPLDTVFKQEGIPLLADLYRPAGYDPSVSPPLPILIYIHGGAWCVGDKAVAACSSILHSVAAHGWLVLSIEYRLAPDVHLPEVSQCRPHNKML